MSYLLWMATLFIIFNQIYQNINRVSNVDLINYLKNSLILKLFLKTQVQMLPFSSVRPMLRANLILINN